MKASQIRDKYKQILQQPQSQNSDDQWQIAYSQMTKQRKKRILTQSSPHKMNFSQNNQNHQNILSIKQKLAQSIANNKQQLKQIQKLKKELTLHQEQKSSWHSKINQFKKQIQQQAQKYQQKDRKIAVLEQEIQILSNKISQLSMDRQLQQKQSDYYKTQLNKCQEDIKIKQRQFKNLDKEIKTIDKIKKQNQYLKNDVERLSYLIEDTLKYGKISKEMMKKHFLGRPYKQLQYWFSQQLVGQVEHFLKKQQIGYGNKQFTAELVKFVDKFSKKSSQSRSKTINTNKVKQHPSLKKPSKIILDNSSYKKHSFNPFSLREQIALKSNTNSFWKNHDSIQFDTLTPHSQICTKSLCWDIITQFKSIVFQLLLQKQVKRKKIKKLVDTMCEQIMQSFTREVETREFKDLNNSGDKKNQFLAIRIQRNEHTAPLKFNK